MALSNYDTYNQLLENYRDAEFPEERVHLSDQEEHCYYLDRFREVFNGEFTGRHVRGRYTA